MYSNCVDQDQRVTASLNRHRQSWMLFIATLSVISSRVHTVARRKVTIRLGKFGTFYEVLYALV